SEGYIPPPEQHRLGGYTTWPARTAGLEVDAEPRIVAGVLALLEQVAGKKSRDILVHHGPHAQEMLASHPLAYWRLDEIEGLVAIDVTRNGRNASYEGGVALYLPGAESSGFNGGQSMNRAVHCAGGRLRGSLKGIGESYSVELWFWNGLPADVRSITGYLVSFEVEGKPGLACDKVGIGGTSGNPGRLFYSRGDGSSAHSLSTTK